MLMRKHLEISKKAIDLIKESAIILHDNHRPETDNNRAKSAVQKNPITSLDYSINPPVDTDPNSEYNKNENDEIEFSNGRIIDSVSNDLRDVNSRYGFIVEDMAVIPAGSDDIQTLVNAGLNSNSPATYIVRDRNTGDLKGGLSVDIDPETNCKIVKVIDRDPEMGNMKSVLAKYMTMPEGHHILTIKKSKIEANPIPPDFDERETDQLPESDLDSDSDQFATLSERLRNIVSSS